MPVASFPDELVEEILSRMPVKFLKQFKCVCKSWCDLISSEEFIISHIKKHKTSVILVNSLDGNYSARRGSINPVYPPSMPSTSMSSVDFTLPESVNNKVPGEDLFPQITSACNGIICLWDMDNPNNIALWNPATKDLKLIPESKLPLQSNCCRVLFGYDDVRNDYKILRFLTDHVGGCIQFELYSLSSGLWKELDCSDIITKPGEKLVETIHSTGGKIVCWLVLHYEETRVERRWEVVEKRVERRWEVVLFDMSTERFESVQVPVEIAAYKYLVLRPYDGSVGVIDKLLREQVWVLNDINSPGGELRSWRKIDVPEYGAVVLKSLGFWEDYILFDDVTRRLIMFDRKRQSFHEVGFSRYRMNFTSTRYKESLVRLL